MARSVRIEYAGAYYHVMARGNRRQRIFFDHDDRSFFLAAVSEACGKTGWRVHAWVLMNNHYHLFLETPEANLVEGMKWLQNTVTRRFNVRHSLWGRVFGDRYKSVLVEGDQPGYYETLIDYIHLNPVRAGLIKPEQGESLLDYPWSSLAGGYALTPRQRPAWLAAEQGLAVFGLSDTASGRRRLIQRLDRRALEEGNRSGMVPLPEDADARMSHLRRGWYWGRQEFAEKMLKFAEKTIGKGRSRAYQGTVQRKAHGQDVAETLVADGLRLLGWKELEGIKGSDTCKVALAKLVWETTTVSQGWIANRLKMRSAANVSQVLRRAEWRKIHQGIPPMLRIWIDERMGNKR